MKLLERCPFYGCRNKLYAVGHIEKKIIIYRCDDHGYLAYNMDRVSLFKIDKPKENLPGFIRFGRDISPRELEKLLSG